MGSDWFAWLLLLFSMHVFIGAVLCFIIFVSNQLLAWWSFVMCAVVHIFFSQLICKVKRTAALKCWSCACRWNRGLTCCVNLIWLWLGWPIYWQRSSFQAQCDSDQSVVLLWEPNPWWIPWSNIVICLGNSGLACNQSFSFFTALSFGSKY